MNPARNLAVLLTLVLALTVAACGDEQEAQKEETYQSVNAQLAETEGVYLDVEGLKYQVQMSRQLNPFSTDDEAYLEGVSEADRDLAKDEEWFAILLRVENPEDHEDLPNAIDFEMHDTQENVYRPVRLGPENNYAYRPTNVRRDDRYPLPNSAAGERPPYGALLLFKIRRFSIDNRPLELIITGRQGQQAIVNLDV